MSSTTNALLDTKKIQTIAYFKNPASDTFGNKKQSMIKAGYSALYADKVANRVKWLPSAVAFDVKLIKTAEKNLNDTLNLDTLDKDGNVSWDAHRLRLDATKFVLKTLAKQKYDDKSEQQAPQVQINIVQYGSNAKKSDVIDGNVTSDNKN